MYTLLSLRSRTALRELGPVDRNVDTTEGVRSESLGVGGKLAHP